MTALGTSRRSRKLLLWLARLTLVVYISQLVAVDHWHTDVAQVFGVEGSAAHVLHCHGVASGCAEGGATGAVGLPEETALAPLPPTPLPADALSFIASVQEAFPSAPDEPPRAA